MLEQVKEIKRLSDIIGTVEEAFFHLTEEVGEVSEHLSNELFKRKELTEPITNECIDVICCALEVYFKSGGEVDDIAKVMEFKIQKWKSRLKLNI